MTGYKEPPKGVKITSDNAKENGAKGGKKKAENAIINKTMKAIGEAIAQCQPTADLIEELKSKYPAIAGDVINNKVLLVAKLFEEALKGNLAAIAMFRDTIGEKPVDKNEHTGKDGERLYKDLTEEELDKRIAELTQKLKK